MTLYDKNKPETIQSLFGSIADHYDQTNSILSFQFHRRWNSQLINELIPPDSEGYSLMDLCCGTGEIAFNALKRQRDPCRAYLIDFCPEMLQKAKAKEKKLNLARHTIDYLATDAQNIPLPSELVKYATIAYGIRNVKDPIQCLREVFRVLQPAGRLGILELTRPSNYILRQGHTIYLRKILPLIGKIIASNEAAYQYLCQSIQNFIKPNDLKNEFYQVGFENVKIIPLLGGIATLIIGQKPII